MRVLYFLILLACGQLINPGTVSSQDAPFSRGVNLTNWFQKPAIRQVQFNRYSLRSFEEIRSLGCDVIRLPINLHFMTDGYPGYKIDPLFFELLDQVVDWAEELELFLILDNHTFDPATNTDPEVGSILKIVWRQMAEHYSDRSEFLLFEILNEPHGISDELWASIQGDVIRTIRSIDTKHTIVVGPAAWNSYKNLEKMPEYSDPNLLYTFHFYDPFIFTHQGATWVDPSMDEIENVPFPYDASRMPDLPDKYKNTWIGSNYNSYQTSGTIEAVKELIDIALEFKNQRQVPIFCGEFGVLMNNAPDQDRADYYQLVRQYLEENSIAWTSWDFHGSFGLFEQHSNGLFNHDLNTNLLEALGLNIPEQTDFIVRPDTLGFSIFDDMPGYHVFESSYNNGVIDYFSKDKPNNGNYCLLWTGAIQYNTIGLDFVPDRDFSRLLDNNFALDFFVRGDQPGLSFQIRFIDSKTEEATDLPWRLGHLFTENDVSWDRKWHHIHFPLSAMAEIGSWYNDTWTNPRGDFDWSSIDKIEIVAEREALGDGRFWFDNIFLSELDTARINDTTRFIDTDGIDLSPAVSDNISAFPNPTTGSLFLRSQNSAEIEIVLFNTLGQAIFKKKFYNELQVDLENLPEGFYFISARWAHNHFQIIKLIHSPSN